MNQIAFILEHTTIYWHPIILALAVMSGICFFMACCHYSRIPEIWAAVIVVLGLILSLAFSRFLYWYSRPDSFESLLKAMTTPASGNFALVGAFAGCGITALVVGRLSGKLRDLADCICVAGCGAIALGRLSNFFTSADRGQILTEMVSLPWAYPVINPASGMPDYRLATFMLQAIVAGVLFLVLCYLFFFGKKKFNIPQGDITFLFFTVYCTSQIILDSTRYDSLYFRSNGFVSIVMVLSAVMLGVCIVTAAVRAVKAQGLQKWMIVFWIIIACLVGLAGYMEYYVQRHGKLAFFSYSIMEHCLVGIVVLTLWLWRVSLRKTESIYHNPHFRTPVSAAPEMHEIKIPSPNKTETESVQPDTQETVSDEESMPELELGEFNLQEFDLTDLDLEDPDLLKAFDYE